MQNTSERTSLLLNIRPAIPVLSTDLESKEHFQNITIRPILKFQNELLIQVFRQYIIKRKNVFNSLDTSSQTEYIANAIKKDLKFKQLLIGLVIGHFTMEESKLFYQNESEYIRRTANMTIKRLQDQINQLI